MAERKKEGKNKEKKQRWIEERKTQLKNAITRKL